MADKIGKLKFEKGDPVNTSAKPNVCPSGHPLSVRMNVAAGQGRIFCPTCQWSDKTTTLSARPLAAEPGTPGFSSPDPRPGGVTVISQAGVEKRDKPRIISARR